MTRETSSHPDLIVVERRPWRFPLAVAGWLVSLLLVAWAAAHFAGQQARQLSSELAQENNRLVQATQQAQAEASKLVQQVAGLTATADIDRAAAEQSRVSMVELQAQVETLQEEISFYRGLMDSNKKRKDVSVGKINIMPGATDHRFRFLVVVRQIAAKHQTVTGKLKLSLIGRSEQGEQTLQLHQLSEQVTDSGLRFKFKYFQNFEGELTLPDGFKPEWVEWQLDSSVSGKSSGKQAWLLKE